MTGVLDVVAGWGLPGGVIDSVEPFEVSRHLPDVVEHRLLGVLTAAMRAGEIFVDDESAVLDAHSAAMAQVLLLEDMMLTAVDVLREAGVDVWLLKGAALAHLLADPGERTFGDNDLLVPANRLPAAVAALEKAGGHRAQPSLSDEWETRFAKSDDAVEGRHRARSSSDARAWTVRPHDRSG